MYSWKSVSLVTCCAVSGLFAQAQAAGPAASCSDLLQAHLPHVNVIGAADVSGALPKLDRFVPSWEGSAQGASRDEESGALSNLPPFCRVIARLSPVPKSAIIIELWLPKQWNGKLLAFGNHGYAGEFERANMAMGLNRHYAVVTTDTGHSIKQFPRAEFAVGNSVAVEDFAWRAVHEMTVTAKALVRLHYTVSASRAYFDGCSDGGREALREAQQFPSDFNGIIAGSPAAYWTRFMASDLNETQAGELADGKRMTPAKLALASKAAVAACGIADGVLADPAHCRWDPRTLECKVGDDPSKCLSAAEVQAIVRVESPIKDPQSGEVLYPGMEPGSEKAWMSGTGSMTGLNNTVASYYRYMVTGDPSWNGTGADVVKLLRQSELPGAPGVLINTTSPDLSAFHAQGGKLIQYHGWNDASMAPRYSTLYYNQVVQRANGPDKLAQTEDYFRLFMVPGMGHCLHGDGPINFGGLDQEIAAIPTADNDVLEALDSWVTLGRAPEKIVATQYTEGRKAERDMPLCPWPKVAVYVSGDPQRAESFSCSLPGK